MSELQSQSLSSLFEEWGAEFGDEAAPHLPTAFGDAATEYSAATTATCLASGEDRGWLEMTGADARGFLQRLLSSHLDRLPIGGGQWSALLNDKGKWISDLLLYAFERDGEECLALDCPRSNETLLNDALERFHFGERLSWSTPNPARLLLLGPSVESTWQQLGHRAPLPPAETVQHEFAIAGHERAVVLARPDRGERCLELVGPIQAVSAVARAAREHGLLPVGSRTLERLRIEAFQPRFGIDFDPETTLPEANEWHRAALDKGCYAGQEVVAKVNTYGEAPWQLCRFRAARATEEVGDGWAGSELEDRDGKRVGQLRSWTDSPRHGGVGLGLVRRKVATNGTLLTAVSENQRLKVRLEVPEKKFG